MVRTGNQGSGVERRVPEMSRMVESQWMHRTTNAEEKSEEKCS